MHRVIDRKLCNTDRAEQIAQCAQTTGRGDSHHLTETRYKTTDGKSFLDCEGGATIGYAKLCEGEWGAGGELHLFDEVAALGWCGKCAVDGSIVVDEFEQREAGL